MRILWVGTSPAAATGYGKQTGDIVQRLDGYEVIIAGQTGDVIIWGGKDYYTLPNGKQVMTLAMTSPLANETSAVEMLKTYIARYKPDLVLGFWDAFSLGFLQNLGSPYVVLTPIDGPATEKWVNYVRNALYVITYSKFGYNELLKFLPASQCVYIPHGCDTDVFRPLGEDKAKLKREIKAAPPIPEDSFLFTYVAANMGERKCHPLLMKTFKRFTERHPDAHLYIHCNAHAPFGKGYDLPMYRAMLGMEDKISFPDVNPILEPKSDEELNRIFNASDVYIHNSIAEGFGIPIMEACAAGTPVIVGNNSSCTELARGHGWVAENVDPDSFVDIPVYVPYMTEYPVIDQNSLLEKMEEAYLNPGLRAEYGRKAREFALTYDWSNVMPKWFDFLNAVEEELGLFKEAAK